MCYAFEYEYWMRRAEEVRKEMLKAEERMKQAKQPKPAAPQPSVEEHEPVPA